MKQLRQKTFYLFEKQKELSFLDSDEIRQEIKIEYLNNKINNNIKSVNEFISLSEKRKEAQEAYRDRYKDILILLNKATECFTPVKKEKEQNTL